MSPPSEYWYQTRQPLHCLLFLAPLLVIYEWGVHRFGGSQPETIRNGADYWMREWLPTNSLLWTWTLPGVLILALLAWHFAGRYPARVSLRTCKGMYAESILFAFLLVMLGKVEQSLLLNIDGAIESPESSSMNQVVTFIGAGIYEEFFFRLCLLPLAYQLLHWMMSRRWAVVLSVLGTSLLFSVAHYLGPGGDQFNLFTFVFRTTAGIYFSALFFLRGFGITVGCHAAYDILVGILLAHSA